MPWTAQPARQLKWQVPIPGRLSAVPFCHCPSYGVLIGVIPGTCLFLCQLLAPASPMPEEVRLSGSLNLCQESPGLDLFLGTGHRGRQRALAVSEPLLVNPKSSPHPWP